MIDSDLFQTIALALLFLILLIQLIQLAVLNGMRRSTGEPAARSPIEDTTLGGTGYGAATSDYGAATTSYEPAGYGGSAGYGGAGAGAGAGAGETSSYGGYTGSAVSTSATPAETATPATEARPEVATSYVPLEQATPAAQTQEAATGTPMLTGNEPEEQPFERDGRWWFKRGGELLVYDEGTGQWVAAPGGAAPATGGTAAPAATAGTAASTYAAPAADTGEGWRCASCGAINGSTATVCRMCFTPRA